MNKVIKFLLRILCLTIFLVNPDNLFAELAFKPFCYLGVGPSLYQFNDKFEEYLGIKRYNPGFYMEYGVGLRFQSNRLHIGSEHTINMDWSVPGIPRKKLRDDYRRLLILNINYRHAWTFGKGDLIDPPFLPFAGISIGWHRASSRLAHGNGNGYGASTNIGFGLFGGFEVKINNCHKINIMLDCKPLYFKTFQAPSYLIVQYGILVAYKLFLPEPIVLPSDIYGEGQP